MSSNIYILTNIIISFFVLNYFFSNPTMSYNVTFLGFNVPYHWQSHDEKSLFRQIPKGGGGRINKFSLVIISYVKILHGSN